MKCSLVHQVRDAVRDAGGCITDTDHGWTAEFDDALRRTHRLDVRYSGCDSGGLEATVELHTDGHRRPVVRIERSDDYINLTGGDDSTDLAMCVMTGQWPVVDVTIRPLVKPFA